MVDINRTCRTCMKNDMPVVDLFGPLKIEGNYSLKLADLLMATTTLQVNREDGLPQNLCVECVKVLQIIYTFRNQALNAENELRKIFLDTTEIKYENQEYDLKHENDFDSNISDSFDNYLFDSVENDTTDRGLSVYICNICDKKFTERKRFLKHLSNHEDTKKICPICNKTFHKQTSLDKHINKHCDDKNGGKKSGMLLQSEDIDEKIKIETINEQYKCSECFQVFDTKMSFLLHSKEHEIISTGDEIYRCLKCSMSYLSENQLEEHLRIGCNLYEEATDRKLDKEQYKCPECSLVFEKQRSLSSHFKKHKSKGHPPSKEKGKLFECDYCDKNFTLKSLLRRHMRLHLLERPYKCTKCSKSYTRRDQLTVHMNKHSHTKQYACSQCSKVFGQLCSLKDHIRTHTGEKPFLCPQCGKRFKNNSNLRQHMMRHTGVKPFSCKFCPKTFCTKGQMKSHAETHGGAHPFKCDECGAAFTKTSSLKKHQLIHLGVKPFACDTCNMRFTSKDHMKRHRRIHTGEKPYRCTHCERAFTQSNDLVKHVRSHLGQNIYQCTVCQAKFRLMRELKRHYLTHYGDGTEPVVQQEGEPPMVLLKGCSEDNLEHSINKQTDTQIKITFNQNSSGDITINIEPEKIGD